tara:strand:- start:159 stop:710 length:552 start_codon:yes stop_codon:yes gene_type:complete
MDRRVSLGQKKYNYVHTVLFEEGYELLSEIKLINFNLKKLADFSKYSITTVYEHFESSVEVFIIEFFEYLRKRRIEEYQQMYTINEKENIILMFIKFSEFMNDEFFLWANLKGARVLIGDKKAKPFFLIDELVFQAEAINLKPELIEKIINLFYIYENSFLDNPSKRKDLTNKFIEELTNNLN